MIIAQAPGLPNPTTALQVNNTALTTAQIFPTVTGGTVALVLPIEGNNKHDGEAEIKIVAGGWATVGGVSPTLNITLYSGTSLTPGSNTVLGVLGGAQSVATSATYDWMLNCRLFMSTKTGKVQGSFSIEIDNTLSAAAALTNSLTSQSALVNPALSLVIGVTFGVANAANVAQLNRFFAYRDDQ